MAEVEDLGGDISSLKDEGSAVINKTKTTFTNPPYSGDQPASGLTPAEKRLRALKKKLQQIENLKEKMEHGETLEKTQLDKITKEQELLEEIHEIESLLTGSAPLI